jgi:hypothetical protein
MARSRNNALEFSSAGSIIIDSAAGATAGSFGAIQFLKDSTISAVTSSTVDNSAKLVTTLAAGTIVYGQFSSVTISSGLVALHKV